jgi:hypothetical protein
MNRRAFITLLGSAAVWPLAVCPGVYDVGSTHMVSGLG